MKRIQNEKSLQINEKTLVVGVENENDIYFARAFDHKGMELDNQISFKNSVVGFKEFTSWIGEKKAEHRKQHVIAGIEPKDHYWSNFAQYIEDHGIKCVLVNPTHLKQIRKLEKGNAAGNDPKTVAMLVKEGRFIQSYIPEGLYSELRTAMETRSQIVSQLNLIRNRIRHWINVYFPEFSIVYRDWECKAALVLLKESLTPKKILEVGVEGIIERWRMNKIRTISRKRATALVEMARISIGVRDGLIAGENDLAILLEDYETKIRQYNGTMNLIRQLTRNADNRG